MTAPRKIRPLRAVTLPTTTTPAPPPKTVTEAAEQGSNQDMLRLMRRRIATAIDDPYTLPRDLAALTRRLVEIARELDGIEESEQTGPQTVPDQPFDASRL